MSLKFTAEDRALLMSLECSLWQSQTRFDRAYVEKTLAPDFFEFGRSGRIHQRADTIDVPAEPIDTNLRIRPTTRSS